MADVLFREEEFDIRITEVDHRVDSGQDHGGAFFRASDPRAYLALHSSAAHTLFAEIPLRRAQSDAETPPCLRRLSTKATHSLVGC